MIFLFNLKDPATVYAYSLITVHHDVMWFIFIILGVVCWSLYKILKDFIWSIGNKQSGLLRIFFFTSIFSFIETFFVIIAVSINFILLKAIRNYLVSVNVHENVLFFHFGLDSSFYIKLLVFFFGQKALENNLVTSQSITIDNWNFFKIYNLIKRKNLDYVLFNFTNNGEFFYDDYSQLLTTHSFRHSTFLEFVWASFPTVIIILILIPSLFLLYSLDEDFYPEFTLKVIGHQWFWTYEYSDWVELSSGNLNRVDIKFDSCLILENDLAIGTKRLLEVDKRVVLPINVTLRFLITSVMFYILGQFRKWV